MLERLKLYLGIGSSESYAVLSAPWRAALVALQVVFVALLILADSWTVRALVALGAIAGMFLLVTAAQRTARPRKR